MNKISLLIKLIIFNLVIFFFWYLATFRSFQIIQTKLSRNVPWMVLYKVSVFRSSRIFKMAARANNML